MTKQEYEEKFKANQTISGFGLDTTMHMPCPFCAAPDFLKYKILDMQLILGKGAICVECKRGCKADFKMTMGGISFELLQTCGEDPPEFVAKMKRTN